ncbi:hypothetical protein BJV82DRAFT_712826 [Fennellomyces sp. T-0311]|nr:hypothetical protein BJV82DRAFT_712826 [Fennellomyces sp. T-0311]
MFAGQELRSTDRPIYGSSAITINDTVYFYGGYYAVPPWNMEALWSIANTIDPSTFSQLSTDPFASPTVIYGQLLSFNNSIYTFGGHHPVNISESLPPEPLRYYRLDLDTLAWAPLQKKNESGPLERYWHSAVACQEKAYLFGGMNITGPLDNDYFWIYHFLTDRWESIALTPSYVTPRCGHTASMLSDGNMVLLGGYRCVGNYTSNAAMNKSLFPLDHAAVFDTITAEWRNQSLGGNIIPDARTYHSAVTTQDNWIIICGGQDGNAQPYHNYISSLGDKQAMTAVLDTSRWSWMIPDASINQPFPRSFAAASLINDTQMAFGFGINHQTIYDGLYVFDSKNGKWLGQETEEQVSHHALHTSVAFISTMIVLGVVVLALATFGCYTLIKRRFTFRIRHVLCRIKELIWCPRAGEPLWAEITRTLFRFLFSGVFIAVVVIIILQVRNSPIIEQKYRIHTDDYTIDVPDIRFCFDGWEPGASPTILCSTDYGTSCSQYVRNITVNIQTGLDYYGDPLACFLFRAPSDFRLGRTNNRHGSGSYLKFHYYGQLADDTARVHVAFYHKLHDPNLPVYHIEDSSSFEWYSPEEDAEFQSTEQENLRTDNAYDLEPNKVTTSSYEIIERQGMQDGNVWNYVGVGIVRDTEYSVSSAAMTEPSIAYFLSDPRPLGALHVFPKDYEVTVVHEQRAFTLVNAMGIIGGIFGLIIGLQACLFGYRPRSPWGVVHRWSVGQMRQSLLDGLRSKFPEAANVPIVHPVHRRFSVAVRRTAHQPKLPKRSNTEPAAWQVAETIKKEIIYESDEDEDDNESSRMARLEERLHVFELLFQAYYINDEVFQSLAFALKADIPSPAPRPGRHDLNLP